MTWSRAVDDKGSGAYSFAEGDGTMRHGDEERVVTGFMGLPLSQIINGTGPRVAMAAHQGTPQGTVQAGVGGLYFADSRLGSGGWPRRTSRRWWAPMAARMDGCSWYSTPCAAATRFTMGRRAG